MLGIDPPKSLLIAVFFTVGKAFCLRGSREHETVKLVQFEFGTKGMTEFVVYTENGLKNHSGSYNALGIAVWTHYACISSFC